MELENGWYSSPRWSWEILDCAMPMTFDTYSNCAHQCAYCFSFFQRAIGASADDYLHHKVRSVDVSKVKRMFTDPDRYAGQFAWYIKRKMVLQWGGLSDGFDWYERKFRKSLELLRFFREIDYPVSISTKGVWFLDDPEYVEVFRDARNIQMKYSIITTNVDHAAKLEAGTPTPAERFRALRRLKDLGIGVTTLRFRPYVIGISDISLESMMREASAAGVDSITAEFLCLESRSSQAAQERFRQMSRVAGYDMFTFYKENSTRGSGLLRLNYDMKRPHFDRMEALADKYGIPFFVSDAHHKERSVGTGCCGLPSTGPLSNINRGQYSEAMQIAKAKGKVFWSDIAGFAEDLKNIKYATAQGFNKGNTQNRSDRAHHTMFDYMHEVWNNPRDGNSPARYFGGALVPAGVDAAGDLIYLFNKPWIDDGIQVKSVAELTLRITNSFEDQRLDGQPAGHVAYPVLVFHLGSVKTSPAVGAISDARIPATIYLKSEFLDEAFAEFPQLDFLPLPDKVKTMGGCLKFLHSTASEQGLECVWMIDGRIRGFKKNGKQTAVRALLSGIEGQVDLYADVAIAGTGKSATSSKDGFTVNANPVGALLVEVNSPFEFNPTAGNFVVEDYCLQALDGGWSTIRHNEWTVDLLGLPNDPDGAADVVVNWGDYTTVEQDGLKIHWNVFQRPLRPKALKAIISNGIPSAPAGSYISLSSF